MFVFPHPLPGIKTDYWKYISFLKQYPKKTVSPGGGRKGAKKAFLPKSGFQQVYTASLPGGSSAALHNVLIGHGEPRVRKRIDKTTLCKSRAGASVGKGPADS